jgi:hypothetical protein
VSWSFVGPDYLQNPKLLVLNSFCYFLWPQAQEKRWLLLSLAVHQNIAYICECCKSWHCKQVSLFLYNQLACIVFCPFKVFLILQEEMCCSCKTRVSVHLMNEKSLICINLFVNPEPSHKQSTMHIQYQQF